MILPDEVIPELAVGAAVGDAVGADVGARGAGVGATEEGPETLPDAPDVVLEDPDDSTSEPEPEEYAPELESAPKPAPDDPQSSIAAYLQSVSHPFGVDFGPGFLSQPPFFLYSSAHA